MNHYCVSFTDKNGEDFLGTIEHFTADGRYNLVTIDDIARDVARKLLTRGSIHGYVVRKGRFSSPETHRVIFTEAV